MFLAEQQMLLARVLTDEVVRQAIAGSNDVEGSLREFPDEARAYLRALDSSRLTLCADLIKQKREAKIRQMLPLTIGLLGTDAEGLFASFFPMTPPTTISFLEEAIAFYHFTCSPKFETRNGIQLVREVGRWELLCHEISQETKTKICLLSCCTQHAQPRGRIDASTILQNCAHARWESFTYEIHTIAKNYNANNCVKAPRKDPQTYLFYKISGVEQIHISKINEVTRLFLDCCVGGSHFRKIEMVLQDRLGMNTTEKRKAFRLALHELAERLYMKRIISRVN
ncbi:MAG: hypothetical protein HYY96_01880 [Candidatus Tectomicrobia bacterium]|nr:hypothetical protein [Candidatus Tectomicrobia bacterium]